MGTVPIVKDGILSDTYGATHVGGRRTESQKLHGQSIFGAGKRRKFLTVNFEQSVLGCGTERCLYHDLSHVCPPDRSADSIALIQFNP